MASRDLTQRQFEKKLEEYGFKAQGVLGYYRLAPPIDNYSVSIGNVGFNASRREKLAYLIQQQNRIESREDQR